MLWVSNDGMYSASALSNAIDSIHWRWVFLCHGVRRSSLVSTEMILFAISLFICSLNQFMDPGILSAVVLIAVFYIVFCRGMWCWLPLLGMVETLCCVSFWVGAARYRLNVVQLLLLMMVDVLIYRCAFEVGCNFNNCREERIIVLFDCNCLRLFEISYRIRRVYVQS